MKLNATRFDQSWDRKRGAAARLTAVLFQEDDAADSRGVNPEGGDEESADAVA
jgi:hypothetical protein